MSVKTFKPVSVFTSLKILMPSSTPGPRKDFIEVLLALSNELLKIIGIPTSSETSFIATDISKEWSRFSITQGPAIIPRLSFPKITSPTLISLNSQLLFLLYFFEAFINSLNKGCALFTLLFNSG